MSIEPQNINVVSGLRQGESQALSILFDRFFSPLCYYATSFINNSDDAKDIVLITFDKLWKNRQNFSSEEKVKAFLYISVKNLCLDFIKIKSRRLNRHQIFSISEAVEDDSQRREVEAELLGKIYEEAAKLPEKCRQVFELTYLEGLSTGEIAERLKMTVTNVTSQRSRAIQLLKMAFLDKDVLLLYFLFVFLAGKK